MSFDTSFGVLAYHWSGTQESSHLIGRLYARIAVHEKHAEWSSGG